MRMNTLWTKTAWGLSFLLGQASLLMGLAIAVTWGFAFALIAVQKNGPYATLPVEPPLIGLLLGVFGWSIAHATHQRIGRYAVAGMLINAFPLILASLLIWQRVLPH